MERRKGPCKSYFLNLLKWKPSLVPAPGQEGKTVKQNRQAVFTPVHSIFALSEALDIIIEEGFEPRFKRHILNAAAFREGIRAMGLKVLAEEAVASPTVTCVLLPEGISAPEVIVALREKHHIRVGGGIADLKERAIRLGHMGLTSSPQYIIPALNAIEKTLLSMGCRLPKGEAIRRTQETLSR
jgi:aspartate aminotransferase-like enzyme